ncbi:cardiolipin synthase (CMP-forming), mitochondrial-like isoform X2 [Dendrobium catenatum]|uniref:cardiolipin synthase (CMP-forming), mitochondrial-like isoform X2 n=1 Tax=Dendrobium catenatum TaxID=906689 RepID=UPI0009F59498|nr:cardiolipin synthase (CMP-forming), mitochondrial-like isoform X2 [Dendrobium catenatum]
MDFSISGRRTGKSGVAQLGVKSRVPGFLSDRGSFEGDARRWAEGGGREGRRGQDMDSLYHPYIGEKEETEMDGGNLHPLQQEQGGSAGFLTLPTVLTLGRVAAVPLLVSNWLDGYLARKMRLGTRFGAFLDPVADKLMVAATLVLLCTRPLEVAIFGEVPWLLTVPAIAITSREITMSAVREWAASQSSKLLEAVAVNNLGKWKTATQMTALTILLIIRDPSLTGPGFLVSTGVFLLYVSAGLALWSLAVYVGNVWSFLIK